MKFRVGEIFRDEDAIKAWGASETHVPLGPPTDKDGPFCVIYAVFILCLLIKQFRSEKWKQYAQHQNEKYPLGFPSRYTWASAFPHRFPPVNFFEPHNSGGFAGVEIIVTPMKNRFV